MRKVKIVSMVILVVLLIGCGNETSGELTVEEEELNHVNMGSNELKLNDFEVLNVSRDEVIEGDFIYRLIIDSIL